MVKGEGLFFFSSSRDKNVSRFSVESCTNQLMPLHRLAVTALALNNGESGFLHYSPL